LLLAKPIPLTPLVTNATFQLKLNIKVFSQKEQLEAILILYLENTTPLSKRVVLFTGIYQSFFYRIFSAKQYMLRHIIGMNLRL
jgi:hypothetical protein